MYEVPHKDTMKYEILPHLCGTSYMSGVFILALQHKDINSAQFVERLKVKTTSFTYFELL